MRLELNWTKEDLKKELSDKRFKTNVIFFVFGLLLYFWFMYAGIVSEFFDTVIILIGSVIFATILSLILFISTKLYIYFSLKKNDRDTNNAYGNYCINLDEKFIEVLINDEKFVYNYKDIVAFKKRINYFYVRTKNDKIGLKFKKKLLGNENYNKCFLYIKNKISC